MRKSLVAKTQKRGPISILEQQKALGVAIVISGLLNDTWVDASYLFLMVYRYLYLC